MGSQMARKALGIALLVLVASSGCTFLDALGPNVQARGPGAAYDSYLAEAETVVVEIDHAPGALWDEDTPAEEQFVDELERVTAAEIEIRVDEELPEQGEDYAYALGELRDLHAERQDTEVANDTEVMHVLFLDGRFAQEGTLGLSFDTRAFALFKGEIRDSTCENDAPVCQLPCRDDEVVCERKATPATREWKVTRAVGIHEAGHLLGLVNSPLPMVQDHEMSEDPEPDTPADENRSHSSNRSSVMWWQLNSAADIREIGEGGEVPWRFGEQDVADARAIQAEG